MTDLSEPKWGRKQDHGEGSQLSNQKGCTPFSAGRHLTSPEKWKWALFSFYRGARYRALETKGDTSSPSTLKQQIVPSP